MAIGKLSLLIQSNFHNYFVVLTILRLSRYVYCPGTKTRSEKRIRYSDFLISS